jgi:hypothetical protein
LLEAKPEYRVLAIEGKENGHDHNHTEPTTVEPSSGFVDFILHRLHVAALRAKIVANEIEATATALSGGLISPEAAILILAETGIEVMSS